MPYTPELIIAFIVVAGLLIYYLRPHYKEEKLELLVKYRRIRGKSLLIQDALSAYILANDAIKKQIMPDTTYGEFLRQLKKNHANYLSEKVYVKVKNSRSRLFLKRTGKLLDEQEDRLAEIEDKIPVLEKEYLKTAQ